MLNWNLKFSNKTIKYAIQFLTIFIAVGLFLNILHKMGVTFSTPIFVILRRQSRVNMKLKFKLGTEWIKLCDYLKYLKTIINCHSITESLNNWTMKLDSPMLSWSSRRLQEEGSMAVAESWWCSVCAWVMTSCAFFPISVSELPSKHYTVLVFTVALDYNDAKCHM